jgi:hypothetical protein
MRSIGGKRFRDPLQLLQVISQRQLRRLWILARARFARRPWVRVANIQVCDGKIAVIKQWWMWPFLRGISRVGRVLRLFGPMRVQPTALYFWDFRA